MFKESQQIGRYKLVRKLGRGGFGEVWLAERKSKFVTTKVAVKLPLDEQINHEAISQEALLWEQASGHQNILPIIDADEYDGQVIIVSEFAPDGSLADKLKSVGKLPVKQAVEMTIGILNGLEFLHSKRIIHRDIKPANILLQGNTPKLADFGISRAMQTTVFSSAIIGTDAYMSPESFEGKRSVQTDVWSVGIVLYQILKGSLPFAQEHPSERMFAILTREFDPLPDDIPQNLKSIIAKALVKKSTMRYQSAIEMREDLQYFLRLEEVSKSVQPQQLNLKNTEISPTQKILIDSDENSKNEIETIVRKPRIFKPIVTKTLTPKNENLSGIIWKFGTNWGGRQNPSVYNFIRDNQIVIGIERFRYATNDLVLITEGFTVKAIAKVQEEPKPLVDRNDYYILFERHNVHFEDWVIYAKAEWYELEKFDFFQYKVQRGGAKVNQPEIRQKVFELWKNKD